MQNFVPENGQIYTETTASGTRSMVPSWMRHSTGRSVNPARFRNRGRGAGSLQEMALRACCWNKHLFMPEALDYAGWVYAEKIYRRLRETDALTFEAWTLFHQAFPAQAQLSHHFQMSLQQTETEWDSIIAHLRKLSDPHVRTFFCGLGISLSLSRLLSLMNIPSLSALSLIPAHRIGRVHENEILADYNRLRNWCRAASEKKALPNLKMLYLGATSKDAAQDTVLLDYLSALPALTLVGFKRTQLDVPGAKTYGPWEWVKKDSDRYTLILKGYDEREHRSVAERVLHLYNIAEGTPLPTSGTWVQPGGSLEKLLRGKGEREVRLSMTCFGIVSSRLDDVVWYRRRSFSPAFCSKRLQESQIVTGVDGGERGEVKRKIRRSKQQDVGSLLGEFN